MHLYSVLSLIIIILMGIYIFFFMERVIKLFIKRIKNSKRSIISIILTFIIIMPTLNMYSNWKIIIFHFVILSWGVELVYYIMNKFIKGEDSIMVTEIYSSGRIPIVLTGIFITYGCINAKNVIEKDYDIYTDKNIRDKGYKINFISDLHFGTTMSNNELQKYCNKISKSNVDIVVLGGDIVDENTTLNQMKDAFKILSSIKNNYGIIYVYGNHDKSRYAINPNYTEEELRESISEYGIKILEDDVYEVNNELCIIGRKDRSYYKERKDSKNFISEFNKKYYNIIIDHQPCEINENSKAGYDLMVSGHTHFGQIWPIGHLMNLFKINEMNYGYEKSGNMDIIVSSGMGGWGYPIRTEKKCEYLIINIQRK